MLIHTSPEVGSAPGKLKRTRKSNDQREFGHPVHLGPKSCCLSNLRWFFNLTGAPPRSAKPELWSEPHDRHGRPAEVLRAPRGPAPGHRGGQEPVGRPREGPAPAGDH